MIIVRFMEISVGDAGMQVNTLRRVNDDKGLGPGFINGPAPRPLWPDLGQGNRI
jgi:hypothetical protein